MSIELDCRVAVITPVGRAAVATVSIRGADARSIVERTFEPTTGQSLFARPMHRIVLGRWPSCSGASEDVVVCWRAQDHVDVHCHGGAVASEAITESLVAAGCERVLWQEIDADSELALEAQARVRLAYAPTYRTAGILLDQFRGVLRAELEAVVHMLDVAPREAETRLRTLASRSRLGQHLTTPWNVVLCGQANVGKSSLINAILGYDRSIVFDQPGTTRDVLIAQAAIDGWPVQLIDTAGIRVPRDPIEEAGIAQARDQARNADLVLHVIDLSQRHHDELAIETAHENKLTVGNKCDLPFTEETMTVDVKCSAIHGQGIETLLQSISERLVPEHPTAGLPVPFLPEHVRVIQRSLDFIELANMRAARQDIENLLGSTTLMQQGDTPTC